MDTTDQAGAWVAGYTDYLRAVVGAADATRVRHLSVVRRFIATYLGQGGPGWTGLSVQRVTEFIQHEAAHALLPAVPGLARRRPERARPRHSGHPARAARQPAAAPHA